MGKHIFDVLSCCGDHVFFLNSDHDSQSAEERAKPFVKAVAECIDGVTSFSGVASSNIESYIMRNSVLIFHPG